MLLLSGTAKSGTPIESCHFWSFLCAIQAQDAQKCISCIIVQEAQWRNFWKAKSSCHRCVSYLGRYSVVPHTFYFTSACSQYWFSFCKFSLFRKQGLLGLCCFCYFLWLCGYSLPDCKGYFFKLECFLQTEEEGMGLLLDTHVHCVNPCEHWPWNRIRRVTWNKENYITFLKSCFCLQPLWILQYVLEMNQKITFQVLSYLAHDEVGNRLE